MQKSKLPTLDPTDDTVIPFPNSRKSDVRENYGNHSPALNSSGGIPATILVIKMEKTEERWVVIWLPSKAALTTVTAIFNALSDSNRRGRTDLVRHGDGSHVSAFVVLPRCPCGARSIVSKCLAILKGHPGISLVGIQYMDISVFTREFPGIRPHAIA